MVEVLNEKNRKNYFWIIWIGILVFLHIGMAAGSEYNDSSTKTVGIVGIVIWWILTIGITAIVLKIQDKKEEKKKIEYKEKYIETIEYEDDRYGKVSFKHNLEKHILSADIKNVNFAGKNLEASILNIDDKTDLKTVFDNLKKYSDNSKSIKERIYPELTATLKTVDTYDKDGNLFEVNEQFLRENFEFSTIVIQDSKTISLWGSWDSLYEQDYSINYNSSDDTIEVESL